MMSNHWWLVASLGQSPWQYKIWPGLCHATMMTHDWMLFLQTVPRHDSMILCTCLNCISAEGADSIWNGMHVSRHTCALNQTLAPSTKTDRVMSVCVLVEGCVGYVSQMRALESIHYFSFYSESIRCITVSVKFCPKWTQSQSDVASDIQQM